MGITIKDIISKIKNELEYLTTLSEPDFRLEQIEQDSTDKNWEVVISYLVKNTNPRVTSGLAGTVGTAGQFEFTRLYKKVKVDSYGNVTGIYIYRHK